MYLGTLRGSDAGRASSMMFTGLDTFPSAIKLKLKNLRGTCVNRQGRKQMQRWEEMPFIVKLTILTGLATAGGVLVAAVFGLFIPGSFPLVLLLIGGGISGLGFLWSLGQTFGAGQNIRASYIRPSYDKTVLQDARKRYLTDAVAIVVPGLILVALSVIVTILQMAFAAVTS